MGTPLLKCEFLCNWQSLRGREVFPLMSGWQLQKKFNIIFNFSPFVEVRDLGGLLSSNGFSMLTIDTDDLKVNVRPYMLSLLASKKLCIELLHFHFHAGTISVHVSTFYGLERDGRKQCSHQQKTSFAQVVCY